MGSSVPLDLTEPLVLKKASNELTIAIGETVVSLALADSIALSSALTGGVKYQERQEYEGIR